MEILYDDKNKLFWRPIYEKKHFIIIEQKYSKQLNADSVTINKIIGEKCYKEGDYQDRIILDLGANIGEFVRYTLNRGAKCVVAVEAETDNFNLLQKNFIGEPKVKMYTSAAAAGKSHIQEMDLSGATGKIKIRFLPIEFWYNPVPSMIKINIGGSEYDLFNYKEGMPGNIEQIILEMHLKTHGINYTKKAKRLNRYLERNRFRSNHPIDWNEPINIIVYRR